MLEPGRTSKTGKKFSDGELHPIADKMRSRITTDDIRLGMRLADRLDGVGLFSNSPAPFGTLAC